MDVLHLRARESAMEARRRNDLNSLEPVDVYKIFSLLNISCIKKPMVETSGAYLRLDNVKVIVINTAKTVGHQNFTAAHEFYHAEFDTGLEGRACATGRFDHKDENEMLADLFAAYFLMPEDGILHQACKKVKNLNNLEINDVIFLEQIFGVSHKSMLIRLKQIGIINEQKMDSFLPNIRFNARLYGFDDYLYRPTNEDKLISDYAEKVKLALDKDLITFSRYEELLVDAGIELNYDDEVQDYVD